MVEVEILTADRDDKPYYKLSARGHAGTAPKGQDLVCAGVSTLVQTLGESVRAMEENGALECSTIDYRNGMSVEAQPASDWREPVATLFAFTVTGLQLLASSYPDAVQVLHVDLCDRDGEDDEDDERPLDLQLFADGGAGDGSAAPAESGAAEGKAPLQEPALTPAQKRLAIRSGTMRTEKEQAKALEGVSYGKPAEEGSEAKQTTRSTDGTKADAAAAGNDTGSGAADAAGAQEKAENADAEFLDLIKGKYAQQFAKAVQAVQQGQKAKNADADPRMDALLAALGTRYGVDGKDMNALTKAISGETPTKDAKYYENLAIEKGMTVEGVKELERLQEEANKANTARQQAEKARAEQQMRAEVQRVKADWDRQAEQLKAKYPNFDYKAARENPAFADLMKRGVNLENAYRAIYFDQLLADNQASTAKAVEKGVTERIAARNARPGENGTRPGGAAVTKTDVNSLSKADREEIERRVRRGEQIRF